MFALHSQLAKDCIEIGDLSLCRILLLNNRHFPWLVLVPKREGLRELFDLCDTDYTTAMQEVRNIAKCFAAFTKADKMNVAAMGNIVPQLHIHIIARYMHDKAWPNPVWNSGIKAEPHAASEMANTIHNIKQALGLA